MQMQPTDPGQNSNMRSWMSLPTQATSTLILPVRVHSFSLRDPLQPNHAPSSSSTLTRAGTALQASPLTKRGLGLRLPLSVVCGRRGRGRGREGERGGHLATCAPAVARAEWVGAARWLAEGERSTGSDAAGALSHGGAAGEQDPLWARRSSSAELAPPPSPRQVSRRTTQPRAITQQPEASPTSAGDQPPRLPRQP